MRLKTILPLAAIAALAAPTAAQAAPKAKLRFASAVVVASEGSGSAMVRVTRQPRNGRSKSSTNTAVSVNYSTSAGTAGASDYSDVSGTLTFGVGEVEKTFLVPISGDADIEGPETVNLMLSAPSRSAVLVNPSTAQLTIADDDGPVQLHFNSASYAVSEFGPAVDITVVRTGQLRDSGNNPVTSTVAYATADGTASSVGSADYSARSDTLTFGADDVAETVSVPITSDSAVEGSESFSLALSSPTNAVFPNGAPTLTAPITIVDDDTASGMPELAFSTASYSGAENGAGIAVTVVRSGPVNKAVSAAIKSSDISALAGADYELLDDTVEFDDGDLTQTLLLPLIDDSSDESDETFSVALSGPAGGTIGSQAAATLTILDDDETPVVIEVPENREDPKPPQVVNVTNTTTATTTNITNTTITNPFANQPGLLLLGARLGSCKLTVGAVKSQRVLRSKRVRVKLHAAQACTGSVKSHVKGRKSLRGVKKGAVQTKVVRFSLKAGQTKTITLRFTKRGYALLKRALGKQRTLSASLLVRSIDSSKRTTLNTLRFKAKA